MRSPCRAGAAARSPPSTRRACAAARSCARRTRSWPPRSRSCTRARGRPSSTAAGTTCAWPSRPSRRPPSGSAPARRAPCPSGGPRPFPTDRAAAERERPVAAVLVHIGGHVAFDSDRIAAYCAEHGIFLLEDCAHAHGADWNGRRPGTWGDAGVFSFYATKTVSTGEGGVLVSRDEALLDHARAFRNYGKPEHEVAGLNFRLSEFTAAIGLVQSERLEEIVAWKNDAARELLDPAHPGHLALPDGMTSGYYKYVVFDPIEKSTGKVYDQPCHRIMGHAVDLPNADWIATNHWCVPLYYRPETAAMASSTAGSAATVARQEPGSA